MSEPILISAATKCVIFGCGRDATMYVKQVYLGGELVHRLCGECAASWAARNPITATILGAIGSVTPSTQGCDNG